ncbi:hypothetical protein [Actinoplanes xinjiangensis]|uniref:hypothetical protein n=1 Tax=Actinoplanes xinjiangensis TaxID=512350 RepID=UPI00341CC6D1
MAGTIHGGVHNNYLTLPSPGASAEQKLETARRFLDCGQATTARRLLNEVIAEEPDADDVCFYWLLAFFSGRTYEELSVEDREQVSIELKRIMELPRTRWSAGIGVINRLVLAGRMGSARPTGTTGIEADLGRLPPDLDGAIRRHLERLIQGSLKDELWEQDVEQARTGQMAGDRRLRAWKFFEPDPKPPRICRIVEPEVSTVAQMVLGAAVLAAVGALGTLSSLVMQRSDESALLALACATATAGIAAMLGVEWRYRDSRSRAVEQERRTIRSGRDALRPGGFADRVDRLYLRYLKLCAPTGDRERAAWLTDAYVPLCRVRDDLAEAYREQKVGADEIKWLIRFQVKDLRRRWDEGESLDPSPTIPVYLPLCAIAGAVVSLVGLVWAVQSAIRANVSIALGAVPAMVFAGVVAATIGIRIAVDLKVAHAARIERLRRLDLYTTEYQRWLRRLADRPTDMEMAQWLDCDRRLLLERALQTYRLKWSDIQAYASLEARGGNSRKARVKNGPWRYMRYRMLVFLLTPDGVRQLTTSLDFEKATFHRWARTNYRYDAVAAVHVSVREDEASEFHLFLVNGTDIQVEVTEGGRPGDGDDPQVLADAAEDVTGLRHTLFVLEGIAAEGRSWWAGPAYRRATDVRA